jgi:hypothetical protein
MNGPDGGRRWEDEVEDEADGVTAGRRMEHNLRLRVGVEDSPNNGTKR